jgi:hypothetical protein
MKTQSPIEKNLIIELQLFCTGLWPLEGAAFTRYRLSLDDQVFFAPREIFDKAGSKRSVPNEESIVSNYG